MKDVYKRQLTVTFDYLNINSLKPAPSMGELDPHNERDNDINRVYKSFCIVRGDVSKNQTLSTWQGKTNIKNPCLKIMGESGWHMPNQAELSIIYLVGTDASAYGEYSKGKFSGLKGQTIFARTSYSGIAKGSGFGQHEMCIRDRCGYERTCRYRCHRALCLIRSLSPCREFECYYEKL